MTVADLEAAVGARRIRIMYACGAWLLIEGDACTTYSTLGSLAQSLRARAIE